jgi:hypothetical protein
MEIRSNLECTWVNWTRNIFPNIFGLSFEVLKIRPRQRCCKNGYEGSNNCIYELAKGLASG